MKAAGADYRLVNYPGGKHAFTNPGATERGKKFNLPLEYNADIDRKSWSEAEAFLKNALK
ncbi:MAG TPA: dienelactone hydrolase family protein [Burkholderiales bacterium]|nr:dienelactone hydrolase family protein [Burkholderiales bacterium]